MVLKVRTADIVVIEKNRNKIPLFAWEREVGFFFKQKTAYEIGVRLVGSEMCIRDRYTEADQA